jgi:hypothetical protein
MNMLIIICKVQNEFKKSFWFIDKFSEIFAGKLIMNHHKDITSSKNELYILFDFIRHSNNNVFVFENLPTPGY